MWDPQIFVDLQDNYQAFAEQLASAPAGLSPQSETMGKFPAQGASSSVRCLLILAVDSSVITIARDGPKELKKSGKNFPNFWAETGFCWLVLLFFFGWPHLRLLFNGEFFYFLFASNFLHFRLYFSALGHYNSYLCSVKIEFESVLLQTYFLTLNQLLICSFHCQMASSLHFDCFTCLRFFFFFFGFSSSIKLLFTPSIVMSQVFKLVTQNFILGIIQLSNLLSSSDWWVFCCVVWLLESYLPELL